MRTLYQSIKPLIGGREPKERFSLRVQNGVEIYEHETVEVCRVPVGSRDSMSKADGPRLVVTDSGDSREPILTRSRSEVMGLSSLLGMLFSSRQQDCSST